MPVKSNPTNPKKKSASPKKGPKPMYTSDPKDPRIQRYNDSNQIYKYSTATANKIKKAKSVNEFFDRRKKIGESNYQKEQAAYNKNSQAMDRIKKLGFASNNPLDYEKVYKRTLRADGDDTHDYEIGIFKKPVQPVIYKKPDKSAEKLNYKKTVTKNTTKVTAPKATAKTKPVSTPVKKTKPVSTPVDKVTMKPTTQEEAKKLKEGFKKQTGREFKSQDSAYNKLEKKLGRKPTVAEYNKSLK
jgi:hypothetical protein